MCWIWLLLGAQGIDRFIFLLNQLMRLGFRGIRRKRDGYGPGSILSECWMVLISILRLLFWMLGGLGLVLSSILGRGLRGGLLLDVTGTWQLIFSSCLREKDKMLLRGILCGGVWNGFLLGRSKEEDVPCRSCGGCLETAIYFGIVSFLPRFRSGRILSLHLC